MMKRWIIMICLLVSLVGFIVPLPRTLAQSLSVDDIEQLSQVVVQIETYRNGRILGTGTGVLVSADGQIFTNRHVVEGGDEFRILILEDPNELPVPQYSASFVYTIEDLDFAVLQIDQDAAGRAINPASLNLPFIEPQPIEVTRGEEIFIFGYPGIGEGYLVVTEGRIATIRNGDVGNQRMPVLYQTDAELAPGNSGGLAVNSAGQIIGIPTEVLSEEQTGGRLGGILPISAILALSSQESEQVAQLDDEVPIGGSDDEDFDRMVTEDCNPLEYGASVQESITNTDWLYVYCFEGQIGDVVTIDMTATGGDLDGVLILFYETLDNVETLNDDRSSRNLSPAIENYELQKAGNYLIVAARYDLDEGSTTGNFSLSLTNNGAGRANFANPPDFSTAPPVAITCGGGLNIENGTAITVVQMRSGFTYTATVLGINRFDPVLAVVQADGNKECNDDDIQASNYGVDLPTTGQVLGSRSSSQLTFSQTTGGMGNVTLVVGGYEGSGGEFVLIVEGMAVTGADGDGDPFVLAIHKQLLEAEIPFTVYMLASDNGLDSFINTLDPNEETVIQARSGGAIQCDDGGSRQRCWGNTESLDAGLVSLGGEILTGNASDAMLTIPLNELNSDLLPFLMTSFEQRTQGQYVLVFHIGVSGR